MFINTMKINSQQLENNKLIQYTHVVYNTKFKSR